MIEWIAKGVLLAAGLYLVGLGLALLAMPAPGIFGVVGWVLVGTSAGLTLGGGVLLPVLAGLR